MSAATITPIRPARIHGAGPLPRHTCLGRQNPDCTANRHGTWSAYRAGCRCPHAREAQRIYCKRLRELRNPPRRIDATGTRRRLQALSAIGWRWADLAAHLGGTWQTVQDMAIGGRPTVMVTTADRVRVLYARLSATPGPSEVSRRRAAEKGWAPPAAWDDDLIDDPTASPDLGHTDAGLVDEVAVTRALAGDTTIRLTDAERVHAVRVGLDRGMSVTAVAVALRMSNVRVRQIRDRDRHTQAA